MSLRKLYREATDSKDELFKFVGLRSSIGWAHVDERREELMKELLTIVNKHKFPLEEMEDKLREKSEVAIKRLATELRCEESMAMYRARIELED